MDDEDMDMDDLVAMIMAQRNANLAPKDGIDIDDDDIDEVCVEGTATSEPNIDNESKKGKFGWMAVDKKCLPYLFRKSDKLASMKMVHLILLENLLEGLPLEIKECTKIENHKPTTAETKLLNEINVWHMNAVFGKDAFTKDDTIISVDDANECYNFLLLIHKKVVLQQWHVDDRCGFVRIGGETVIPYIIKENIKYAPLFYCEGVSASELEGSCTNVDGWDLIYLRTCCIVQGICNDELSKETVQMVKLDKIKSFLPPKTYFEDYWPKKVNTPGNNATESTNPNEKKVSNGVSSGKLPDGKPYPGKLTKIKDFPTKNTDKDPAYVMKGAFIRKKVIQCLNVKPHNLTNDLLITLPDLASQLYPDMELDKVVDMLVKGKVSLFQGNQGHQDVLKAEGKCSVYNPVPLIRVKELLTFEAKSNGNKEGENGPATKKARAN